MLVYITGRHPPVCHTDRNCFGIVWGSQRLEVSNLLDIPDHYEMCFMCNPVGIAGLGPQQKVRARELRKSSEGIKEA